jgi:hypothetical protein
MITSVVYFNAIVSFSATLAATISANSLSLIGSSGVNREAPWYGCQIVADRFRL